MQVFVKLDKTYTLEIDPSDTIPAVKQRVAEKIGGLAEGINLTWNSKPLKDDCTVSDYGIMPDSTLHVSFRPLPSSYDSTVKSHLSAHLQNLMKDMKPQLVFIALGSYDNNHGKDSIRRQQCPSGIFHLCETLKWELTILLIDVEFAKPRASQDPQIDCIDSKWQLDREEEKVRAFKCCDSSVKGWLFTYGTQVLASEYGGVKLTLADLDLQNQVGPAIASAGGALVVGNFYAASNIPYLFAGSQEHLLQVLAVFGHNKAENYYFFTGYS